MSSMLPDPALLASQATDSQMLQKQLETQRLQKQLMSPDAKEKKLREATKGFESVFINKLWQQMRKTVPKEGYLHSKNEEMYLSMFDQALSEKLADAGGIGLGDMLYEQLKQSMEDASRVTSPSENSNEKPIKELVARYDPRMLNPKEAELGGNAAMGSEKLRGTTSLDALYEPFGENDGSEESPAEGASEERSLSGWDADTYPEQAPPSPEQAANDLEKDDLTQSLSPEAGPKLVDDPTKSFPKSRQAVASARDKAADEAIDPEVMAAVEALARRITPNVSPVTREARHAKLTPSIDEALNPSPAKGTFPTDKEQEVSLLEGGINRKQGAMENEGGLEPLRGVPGLADAPAAATPEKLELATPEAARNSSVEVTWGADASRPAEATPPASSMQWPVEGRVTANYGWRNNPYTGERTFHEGVDVAAASGSPVKACWDGVVSYVGNKPGYGNVVVMDHPNGWQSVYAHNNDFSVKAGETIKAGEEIATVGNTGRSTGPHVHFELRHQGTAFDPMKVQNSLAAGSANGRQA